MDGSERNKKNPAHDNGNGQCGQPNATRRDAMFILKRGCYHGIEDNIERKWGKCTCTRVRTPNCESVKCVVVD